MMHGEIRRLLYSHETAASSSAPDGGGYSWVQQTGEAAASALLDAAVS